MINLCHTKSPAWHRGVIRFASALACFFIAGGVWFISPAAADAAELYLLPATDSFMVGETFIVEFHVNTQGEAVNAFAAGINFPPQTLEVVQVIEGGSLIDLWVERPSYSNTAGTLSFQGGRTGGLTGEGVLLKILFRARLPGAASISFQLGSQVLQHDGEGTPARTVFFPARYAVRPTEAGLMLLSSPSHPSEVTWYGARTLELRWPATPGARYSYTLARDAIANPDEVPDEPVAAVTYRDPPDGVYTFSLRESLDGKKWAEPVRYRLLQDRTPPELFRVVTGHDEAARGGRAYAAFAAGDAASGVARYEVSERRSRIIGRDHWQPAQSPYLLSDQTLKSIIKVRAVDQAGNVRTVVLGAEAGIAFVDLLPLVLVGIGITIGYWIWRRYTSRIRIRQHPIGSQQSASFHSALFSW